jgi:hypothetical protein
MAHEDIAAALLRLDAAAFTPEQLASLAGAVPSEEERGALRAYLAGCHPRSPGSSSPAALGPAERYLLAVAAVPQLAERIAALAFCSAARATVAKVQVRACGLWCVVVVGEGMGPGLAARCLARPGAAVQRPGRCCGAAVTCAPRPAPTPCRPPAPLLRRSSWRRWRRVRRRPWAAARCARCWPTCATWATGSTTAPRAAAPPPSAWTRCCSWPGCAPARPPAGGLGWAVPGARMCVGAAAALPPGAEGCC